MRDPFSFRKRREEEYSGIIDRKKFLWDFSKK